jgi:hypothetical protein
MAAADATQRPAPFKLEVRARAAAAPARPAAAARRSAPRAAA